MTREEMKKELIHASEGLRKMADDFEKLKQIMDDIPDEEFDKRSLAIQDYYEENYNITFL